MDVLLKEGAMYQTSKSLKRIVLDQSVQTIESSFYNPRHLRDKIIMNSVRNRGKLKKISDLRMLYSEVILYRYNGSVAATKYNAYSFGIFFFGS